MPYNEGWRSNCTNTAHQGRSIHNITLVNCRDEERQFQLYESDPSGNYGGWKATAIGAGHQGATNLLKQDYSDDISLQAAVKLVIQARAAAEQTRSHDVSGSFRAGRLWAERCTMVVNTFCAGAHRSTVHEEPDSACCCEAQCSYPCSRCPGSGLRICKFFGARRS